MKKLLLIAAALTTMVSCSKTQVIPEKTAQQEIAMKAYNQAAVKAIGPVAAGALPTDSKMKVFGFYANNGTDYATTPYLDGAIFAYDNSNTSWRGLDETATPAAIKPYYWPTTGKMNFVAVYPTDYPYHTSTGITNSTGTITVSNINLGTFATQKDIMYSVTAFDCPQEGASALAFNHLLSQVVVNVKPTVDGLISLKSVKLLNAYVKGNIVIANVNTTPSVSYTYDATTPTGEVTYTLESSVSGDGSTNNYITTTKDTDGTTPLPKSISSCGALVLPTKIGTGSVEPQILIEYYTKDAPSVLISQTLTLCSDDGTEVADTEAWKAGNKYIYNVTISPKEITFTATVNAWTDETVSPAPSI